MMKRPAPRRLAPRRLALLTLALTTLGAATQASAATKLRLVEVITSPERTVLLKELVAGFQKANPGVEVEIVSYPFEQSFEKLLSSVQAGDAPDVVEMPDKWLALFAGTKKLSNLEPYAKTWADGKKLEAKILDAGRIYEDTLYTIPYGFYLNGLFYNKKLFAEKKLAPPKTFAEFMNAAKVLTDPKKNQYGYCLRGARGVWDTANFFIQGYLGSSDWFNKDGSSVLTKPDAIKGFEAFASLYRNGYAPKASVNWGFNETVSGFYSGNCAMLNQDPDALAGIAEKMPADTFGLVPMPVGPKGIAYPKLGFAGWSMFDSSKNKDAAWKLVSYLSNAQSNLKWAKHISVLPAYTSARLDPVYKQPAYQGWFNTMNSKQHKLALYPFDLPELGYFYDVLATQELDKLLLGEQDAKTTATKLADYLTKARQKQMGQK